MIKVVLPGGGNSPEYVNVTIHGAALETVTIKDAVNDQIITCDTNSTGEGMATLITGRKYILTGSISGYTSEEQKVASDNIDLYAMPLGAIYWYGNECSKVTGGWTFPTATTTPSIFDNTYNNGALTRKKNTNDITISVSGGVGYGNLVSTYATNIIDLSNYSKIKAIITCTSTRAYGNIRLTSYSSKPDGIALGKDVIAYDMLNGSTGAFSISERNFEINISNITDKGYINVSANAYESGNISVITVTAKIHKIWLE